MTSKNQEIPVAVIGGSGLYAMEGAKLLRELTVKTPFGNPSDSIAIALISGIHVAFLPRHGKGHRILPTEINNRANIYALKTLGVKKIIGVGATGSLKEELAPKHLVIPDQLVDKTRFRVQTFFGDGIVGHVQFNHPFCPALSGLLYDTAQELGITAHKGGVSVTMEGPAFSTLAESQENRRQGYSLIGMTAAPEAKLSREAEICYSSLAFVTDYDCWKEGEEVSLDVILENLHEGSARAQKVIGAAIKDIVKSLSGKAQCHCAESLKFAIVTDRKKIPAKTLKALKPLVGKYF